MDSIALNIFGHVCAFISGCAFGYLIKSAVDAHIDVAAHRIAMRREQEKRDAERFAKGVIDITNREIASRD